jgi:hypothetical protein
MVSQPYAPREGDEINVRLTVAPNGRGALTEGTISAVMVSEMLAVVADRVELVSRAEPDWQPDDIGQHIVTGELYQRTDVPGWCCMTGLDAGGDYPADYQSLKGKLRRMRLVPEDDA